MSCTAPGVTAGRLIAIAQEGGLRPHIDPVDRYRRIPVILNGAGRDALFGVIYVSAVNGRVISAYLTHGNAGVERKHETVAEIRTALKSWAAVQRSR